MFPVHVCCASLRILFNRTFTNNFYFFIFFLLKTQLLYYQNNKTKNLWYSRTFLIFYYVSNAIRSVYKGGNQVGISSLVSIPALSSIINNKEVYVFIVIGLTRCSRVLVENCPDIVHTTGHQQLQLQPPPPPCNTQL